MNASALSAIRDGGHVTRTIATFVILTFGGLVTAPAVASTRAEIERQERIAPREQSQSEKLNATLLTVQEKLRTVAGKPDVLGRMAAQADRKQARDALKSLLAELREQDKAARKDFREIEQQLKRKNVPSVILERHEAAVEQYNTASDALLADIQAIAIESDDIDIQKRAEKALERLERQKLRESQQPFDPEQLPNRSLRAKDEHPEPRTSTEQFITADAAFDPDRAVASLDGFDISGLTGADNPAYLAETTEVVITEAIEAKAAELDHNPVKIHNWVRNNVQWQPAWGAVQSAELTLSAQRGNAFDIASLTIALLRASDIPARYAHGTIEVTEERFRNWIGGFEHINAAIDYAADGGIPVQPVTGNGVITKVRLEHVWVEAAIDFHPSRGAINRAADTWVPMDPSFKQYDYLEGLDPIAISGIDPEQLANDFLASGSVDENGDWVTGFDPTVLQNAQAEAQQALEDHIEQNLPDATVGDVLGGRKIIEQQLPILAGTLENRIVLTGNRYAALPQNLQQRMTFGFQDAYGSSLGSVSYPFAEVNNQRITLSFKPATQADEDALASLLPEGEITDISQLPTSIPAYLINVVPELKVGDNVVLTGNSMTLGEEITFRFTPEFAGRYGIPNTYNVIAGSYLAIAAIAGNVGPNELNNAKARLEATKARLESGDPAQLEGLTREDLLGDLFHAGLLGYYGQYTALSYVAGLKQGGHHYLAGGVGSFGYEPNVTYTYGIPKEIHGGGAVMNIPIVNIHGFDGDGSEQNQQERINYVLQVGTLSSALEHAVPEQMFVTEENPGEAISAVKALSKATQQGQRVYHITRDNQTSVLPNINHNSLVMTEIRNALNTGKEVITHTDAVNVPGWSGAGYIIYDPVTGDGAYKIGGGENGAFFGFVLDKIKQITALFASLASEIELFISLLLSLIGVIGDALSEVSEFFGDVKVLGHVLGTLSTVYDVATAWNDCYGIAQLIVPVLLASLALLVAVLSVGVASAIVFSIAASVGGYFLKREYC